MSEDKLTKENDKPQENQSDKNKFIIEETAVYVAIIPNSPQRLIFKEFQEVKKFLDSPKNSSLNTSARFKKCANEEEVDSFYEEFSNISLSETMTPPSSSFAVEPKAMFSEPDATALNKFRSSIERKDNSFFDKCVNENPRFLINTASDCPTIIQGSQRQNALHTACACGNSYVVQKIFELSDSHEFLTKAYGKIDDVDMLKDHFIDCFVNTPDKNANNTPLHFACKNDHLEVVQLLLSKTICSLSPKNRYSQTPFEIASLNIKKTPEGKSLQNSEILD